MEAPANTPEPGERPDATDVPVELEDEDASTAAAGPDSDQSDDAVTAPPTSASTGEKTAEQHLESQKSENGVEGWTEVEVPVINPEMEQLREKIRQTMAYYFFRPENNVERSPWGVMHCIIAYGVDTPFLVGDQKVNAISWMCYNGPCYNMRLLYDYEGRVGVRKGPGYQGHNGQFLFMLAMSRVKADYPIIVEGQTKSVADLVEFEKLSCEPNSELTFKLVGLSHYLNSDDTWKDREGRDWSIERLLKEEMAQPVVGACCGGAHRLTGLSYAVHRRKKEGKPLTGQWKRADAYVRDFQDYTFRLQNSDGSFSTNWFEGRGNSGDLDRKLNTSGHVLEWILLSLAKERLTEPQVLRAVTFINDLLWDYRGREWEIGPRGHALHALSLFDQRVFGGKLGNREQELGLARADLEAEQNIEAMRTANVMDDQVDDTQEDSGRPRRLRRFAR